MAQNEGCNLLICFDEATALDQNHPFDLVRALHELTMMYWQVESYAKAKLLCGSPSIQKRLVSSPWFEVDVQTKEDHAARLQKLLKQNTPSLLKSKAAHINPFDPMAVLSHIKNKPYIDALFIVTRTCQSGSINEKELEESATQIKQSGLAVFVFDMTPFAPENTSEASTLQSITKAVDGFFYKPKINGRSFFAPAVLSAGQVMRPYAQCKTPHQLQIRSDATRAMIRDFTLT